MSAEGRFVANSIEELLVSLAEGVREAQEALSEAPPVDALGRPQHTYQIPFLDFEIEVEVQAVTVESAQGPTRRLLVGPRARSRDTKEISSKLTGRLVAVPPGEGLPIPRVTVSSAEAGADRQVLTVRAENSAGEVLSGKRIELNIDMDASRSLSAADNILLTTKRPGTKLEAAEIVTDDDGVATTSIAFDPREPAGAIFVISVQLGTTAASLVIVR